MNIPDDVAQAAMGAPDTWEYIARHQRRQLMPYQILQRTHVIATSANKTNAEDIAEALNTYYPNIPFTVRSTP